MCSRLGKLRACLMLLLVASLIAFFHLVTMTSVEAVSAVHDMDNPNSYNFRIDGVGGFNSLQVSDVADIDKDGLNDIVIGAYGADYNGRSASGSLYIIYGSLFRILSTNNKVINLSNPENYNIRFDGASSEDWVGYVSNYRAFQDVNSDGEIDLLISSARGDANSRNRSGSLYVVYNSILTSKVGTGNILDLSNGNNYNLRFDGSKLSSLLGYVSISVDINGNEVNDLLINSASGHTNNSGSLYIFYDSFLSNYHGTGNNIDLLNPANFTIRYDGINSGDYFSQGNIAVGDVNQDGANDLVVGSDGMDHNGSNSGSVYVINNSIISGYQGTGNVATVANPATYTVRIDGPQAGASFGNFPTKISDVNSDGKIDLVAIGQTITFNGRTNAGVVYLIDNSTFASYSGTGNTINVSTSNNYRYRIAGSVNGSYLSYLIGIKDFDYDDKPDLFLSIYNGIATGKSNAGAGYVIYNNVLLNYNSSGNTLDLSDLSSSNLRYAGANSSDVDKLYPIGDIDGDGRIDLVVFGNTDYNGADSGSAYFILNFPHTISLDPLPENTAQDMFTLTGSVSAPNSVTSIAGVEWSLDNNPRGTWTACSATDGSFSSTLESFSCEVTGYTEGTHQIYVRAYDTNTSYTASSRYASVGKRKDTTAPKLEYIVTDPVTGKGYEKTFKATALNAMDVIGDTHFPQFCFTKAYDDGAGVASYTIVVDGNDYLPNIPYNQPPIGDNGDTRQEGDSVIKENNNYYFKYHLYNQVSKQQEICAYGKTDSHYLEAGVHKWSVKATDNAGNSTSTDTLRFLVMTNQGVQSKPNQSVWFPLTLLQVGNRTNLTNYSTTTPELFTKDTKPLTFFDSTPTFYGIAPVGTKIELTLQQSTTNQAGSTTKQHITTQSTTANQSSEWGINTITPLTTGTYYVTIQATDTADNFAILKDIPLRLTPAQASTVLGATTQAVTESDESSLVEDPSPTSMQPTPTTKPLPTPTPTTKPFCIWKWCW